jgi:hypothetical protein
LFQELGWLPEREDWASLADATHHQEPREALIAFDFWPTAAWTSYAPFACRSHVNGSSQRGRTLPSGSQKSPSRWHSFMYGRKSLREIRERSHQERSAELQVPRLRDDKWGGGVSIHWLAGMERTSTCSSLDPANRSPMVTPLSTCHPEPSRGTCSSADPPIENMSSSAACSGRNLPSAGRPIQARFWRGWGYFTRTVGSTDKPGRSR